MYKARRGDTRQWLGELERLVVKVGTRVFSPIGDLATLATFRLDGHPSASLAAAVEEVVLWRGRLGRRSPSMLPQPSRGRAGSFRTVSPTPFRSLRSHPVHATHAIMRTVSPNWPTACAHTDCCSR